MKSIGTITVCIVLLDILDLGWQSVDSVIVEVCLKQGKKRTFKMRIWSW